MPDNTTNNMNMNEQELKDLAAEALSTANTEPGVVETPVDEPPFPGISAERGVPHGGKPVETPEEAPSPEPIPVELDESLLESPVAPPISNPRDTESGPASVEADTLTQEQIDLINDSLPDIPEAERMEKARFVVAKQSQIAKQLMIDEGFKKEEAMSAAIAQIRRELKLTNEEYKKENPKTADIVIDKTVDPASLNLTQDEHDKLQKVERIKLVVVKDLDLSTLDIERPPEDHKVDYIRSIEGNLAKYSVPLPLFGDFVNFKGAQIIQMVNAVYSERDTSIDELIQMKASLIYDKLNNGLVLRRYDMDGKQIMNFNEFINKFPFQDLDIAMFGILCASSMETSSTELTCETCTHKWTYSYAVRDLLDLSNIPEKLKERVDQIHANKGNDVVMRGLYEDARKAVRLKSPLTENIYDMSYPSIARAIDLLKRIDQNDQVMMYLAAVAMYISAIYVYNPQTKKYIEVKSDEVDLMLDTMQTLPETDVNLLASQTRENWSYSPQFNLHAQCPSCGHTMDIPLSVDQLVFLRAQDSGMEMA